MFVPHMLWSTNASADATADSYADALADPSAQTSPDSGANSGADSTADVRAATSRRPMKKLGCKLSPDILSGAQKAINQTFPADFAGRPGGFKTAHGRLFKARSFFDATFK